jgi:hypothetical protein
MTKVQHTKPFRILEVLGLDYVELVPSGLPEKYRYRAWSLPKAAQNGEGRPERKGTVELLPGADDQDKVRLDAHNSPSWRV